MTILESHTIFKLIYDKERNDFLKHEDIDRFLDTAQMQYFAMLIGSLKGYPQNQAFLDTNQVRDRLDPFKEKITFLNVEADTLEPYGTLPDGEITLPSDYEGMSAMTSLYNSSEWPIEETNDDEWGFRASSKLLEPEEDCAIYKMEGNKIRVLPKSLTGILYYYRKPKKPVFAYSVNGRLVVQDVDNSTDLEWNEVATQDIIKRALVLAGIKIDDQMLYQAMNIEQQKE